MTEQEWLTSGDPHEMLDLFQDIPSERRFRLFAVACCRRHLEAMPDLQCRLAVDSGERFADGNESLERLRDQWHATQQILAKTESRSQFEPRLNAAAAAMWTAIEANARGFWFPSREVAFYMRNVGGEAEAAAQAHLLRCVFGNPFRPVVFDPEWGTSTVRQLARHIYDERDFAQMPILADALQDAGCADADVLNHCREANGVHARGCWVVDAILGKV